MYQTASLPTRSATLGTIEEIVRDVTDDDSLRLTVQTRPADIEAWDSLAHVSIVFSLEEAFGRKMDDALLEGFETIGELVAILDRSVEPSGNRARY